MKTETSIFIVILEAEGSSALEPRGCDTKLGKRCHLTFHVNRGSTVTGREPALKWLRQHPHIHTRPQGRAGWAQHSFQHGPTLLYRAAPPAATPEPTASPTALAGNVRSCCQRKGIGECLPGRGWQGYFHEQPEIFSEDPRNNWLLEILKPEDRKEPEERVFVIISIFFRSSWCDPIRKVTSVLRTVGNL